MKEKIILLYRYSKLNKRNFGHSIIELVMAMAVFSLFMAAAFLLFSFGLKNWKLVEIKNEVQNQSEVAIGRMSGELLTTDISSLVMGTGQQKYMVFDTAMNPSTNKLSKDGTSPLWVGYILYYLYPSDPDTLNKKLLRRYIPHTATGIPSKMTDISLYLIDSNNTGDPRTVARDIYNMDISLSNNNYIIDISLVTWKKFSERRLAYNRDFSDEVANETLTLKASVMPRNSQN